MGPSQKYLDGAAGLSWNIPPILFPHCKSPFILLHCLYFPKQLRFFRFILSDISGKISYIVGIAGALAQIHLVLASGRPGQFLPQLLYIAGT